MPIKNKPSRDIPFLNSYTPYSTDGEFLVENIDEMFSYSIAETENPVNLQYTFGSVGNTVQTFSFTNVTKNVDLEFQIQFDEVFTIPTSNFILAPSQSITIPLQLQTENLDVGMVNKNVKMNLSVTNLSNGSLVYKDLRIPIEEPTGMGTDIFVYI